MSRVGLAGSVVTALGIKTLALMNKTVVQSEMLHQLIFFSFFHSFLLCQQFNVPLFILFPPEFS